MDETPPARPPSRFSALDLILMIAALAASYFSYVQWGQWGLPTSILLAIYGCLQLSQGNGLVKSTVLVMAVLMIVIALAGTYVNHSARSVECINRMKQIGIAIDAYYQDQGHYPPPYSTDKNGNPLHSWRVLILPYIGEEKFYEEFDLTQPWHHPTNLALADRMPLVYNCLYHYSKTGGKSVTTAYVAIVGEHTAWPHAGLRKVEDIVDGPASTLLLVESEKHRIHWMSTADPGIETLGPTSGDGKTLLAHGPHESGFFCVFCNGSVKHLRRDYLFSDFLSLLSVDGGEEHNLPWLE